MELAKLLPRTVATLLGVRLEVEKGKLAAIRDLDMAGLFEGEVKTGLLYDSNARECFAERFPLRLEIRELPVWMC